MLQKEEALRNYLQFIRKYDFVICLSTLLVLGAALVISVRIPKTYSASTLIRLIQPNTTSPLSTNNLFQSVFSGGVDRREMATISERFSTESMLNAAIERLEESEIGKVQHFPSVGNLKQKLQARIHPDADYIELSIELTEAEGGERNAALLVNQLARDMQTLRSQEEERRLGKLQSFLVRKKEENEQETKQLIEETLRFVQQNGSPETWYPQLSNLLERYGNLQERLAISEQALHTANRRLSHFQTQQETLSKRDQISESQNYNPVWLHQREKLLELESQRIGNAEKAGQSSHELSALKAQIENIQEQSTKTPEMATLTTIGTSQHYVYIQNQLIELPPIIEGYENETEQLTRELKQTGNQLQELLREIPEYQHTLTQLRAKIELNGTLTEEIAKRYLETEILSTESDVTAAQKGGIEIVDIATPRKIPVSPQFKLIVVLAGVVGLCLGVTIALLIEYFMDSLNSYQN